MSICREWMKKKKPVSKDVLFGQDTSELAKTGTTHVLAQTNIGMDFPLCPNFRIFQFSSSVTFYVLEISSYS